MNPTRQQVVDEAKTWLRTPYHHRASVKGAGVDCAMILVEVYHAVGMVDDKPEIEEYPSDFMAHRNEELYLGWVEKYAKETDKLDAGNIVIWRFGRVFSHGGILIDDRTIIHSYRKAGMVILDDVNSMDFAGRDRKIFTFWNDK